MRLFRPQPRISLASASEAGTLAGLYGTIWEPLQGHLDERLLADQSPATAEVAAWFRGGFELYVARLEGELAGVVRCSFPTGTCFLDRIGVVPALRRRGVGRALLDHAVSRARRAGVAKIWLNLSPKLAEAVGLFRAAGFTESGYLRAHYWGEDLVLMELRV
ncbi:MAG: GNAT family N-acetyltransferase [Candidatus Dormibacteraceae bacterium]